jgi:hypothetical protein
MMAPGTENALVPTPGSEQKSLDVAVKAAAEFIAAAKADNTRRAYAAAAITSGPVFRGMRRVRVLGRRLKAYAAHSAATVIFITPRFD